MSNPRATTPKDPVLESMAPLAGPEVNVPPGICEKPDETAVLGLSDAPQIALSVPRPKTSTLFGPCAAMAGPEVNVPPATDCQPAQLVLVVLVNQI